LNEQTLEKLRAEGRKIAFIECARNLFEHFPELGLKDVQSVIPDLPVDVLAKIEKEVRK